MPDMLHSIMRRRDEFLTRTPAIDLCLYIDSAALTLTLEEVGIPSTCRHNLRIFGMRVVEVPDPEWLSVERDRAGQSSPPWIQVV